MFCPACGFEYTQKTNYCKRCGAGLSSSDKAPALHLPTLKITGVFFVIAAFTLFSLMFIFEFYKDMMNRGIRGTDAVVPFILGITVIGAVAGLLSWQLSRLITAARGQTEQERPTFPTVTDVQPQIAAPREPIPGVIERPSVAEHTTRHMTGAYREPQARE